MQMPVTTTFTIEGFRIREYKGVVRGIIVRSPTIAQGIMGGLKNIIGGKIGAYTQMCEQARQQAYELLMQHAQEIGANAVLGLRYDASDVADSAIQRGLQAVGVGRVGQHRQLGAVRREGDVDRRAGTGRYGRRDAWGQAKMVIAQGTGSAAVAAVQPIGAVEA